MYRSPGTGFIAAKYRRHSVDTRTSSVCESASATPSEASTPITRALEKNALEVSSPLEST